MESLSLDRPEHLDDDSWRAVEEARGRVHFARQMGDLSEVVGKSKELVETVARVVILSTAGTVNEKLDFQPTVTAAHKALERQPGVGLANNEPLRAIAQSRDQGDEPLGVGVRQPDSSLRGQEHALQQPLAVGQRVGGQATVYRWFDPDLSGIEEATRRLPAERNTDQVLHLDRLLGKVSGHELRSQHPLCRAGLDSRHKVVWVVSK